MVMKYLMAVVAVMLAMTGLATAQTTWTGTNDAAGNSLINLPVLGQTPADASYVRTLTPPDYGATYPTTADPAAGKSGLWVEGMGALIGGTGSVRGDRTFFRGYNLSPTANGQACAAMDNHCIFDRTEVYYWNGTYPSYEHHMGFIGRDGIVRRIWNMQARLDKYAIDLGLQATQFAVYDEYTPGVENSYFSLSSTTAMFNQTTGLVLNRNNMPLLGLRTASAGGSSTRLLTLNNINMIQMGGAAPYNGHSFITPVLWSSDESHTIALGSGNNVINDNDGVIKFVKAKYNITAPAVTLQTMNPHVAISASSSDIRLGASANFFDLDTRITRPAANNLQLTAMTANATTTITLGRSGQNKGTCLELFDHAGNPVYLSVAPGADTVSVSPVSCK